MRGVINTRDVLTHLPLIWREFGTACVLRCLWATLGAEPTTFLEIALCPHRSGLSGDRGRGRVP